MRMRLLEWLIRRHVRVYLDIEAGVYIRHALIGEAFSARMYAEHPDRSEDAIEAYEWAEKQFLRIARGKVGERDLIG